MAELDALLDRTASLAARPRVVEELPGGLTNRNYKVTTPDGTFVARISAAGTDLLAIDRDIEYRTRSPRPPPGLARRSSSTAPRTTR